MSRARGRQQQVRNGAGARQEALSAGIAPGKRARTDALPPTVPVQRKQRPARSAQPGGATRPIHEWMYDPGILAAHGFAPDHASVPVMPVQARGQVAPTPAIHDAAAPACAAVDAAAYARGNQVAFAGTPDLHTAAHEAAHVVQQRGGVQLAGGVGRVGDPYEQHADDVADAVVAGRSAEALLDRMSPASEHGAASPGVQRAPATAPVQMREGDAERGRQSGNDELDRRLDGDGSEQADGSGDWGAEGDDRGMTDRANHYMWTRVSLAAESLGLTNAARHMRHYLGNTGADLDVEPDLMLRDVPDLQSAYDARVASLLEQARQRARAGTVSSPVTFSLASPRMADVYCHKSVSEDWFYAIGGFTYWVTAEVTLTPPEAEGGPVMISMETQLHIFDRYNWDQGKSVTIAGITVTDEQLGRLHRVGLAREYDVHGTSSVRTTTWEATGSTSTLTETSTSPSDREGGRTDATRERGRHFENVRGSE